MEKILYAGRCVGGPMDGHDGTSRFPNGFVAVDKPSKRAWIYEWHSDAGMVRVRDANGAVLDHSKVAIAAVQYKWDVVALP